jgi:hypothetical protein
MGGIVVVAIKWLTYWFSLFVFLIDLLVGGIVVVAIKMVNLLVQFICF